MDDMPHGGVRTVPELQPWQLPTPRRLGNVVMASGIIERWTVVAPRFDH
jgi:hypothetical protein